ncbi:MAG: hypothetical protein AAFQ39_04790 [Pseudomonadota bacterium]
MKITEMIGRTARRRGVREEIGTCIDVLIDTKTNAVLYALVELGVSRGRALAIVARDRIAVEDGALVLGLTDDDLDRAERLDTSAPEGPIDLTTMPPVVIGPFGYTVAPTMAGALINAMTGNDRAERPAVDSVSPTWHWFENLHGLPVFDETGLLGHLDTIVVNPASFDCMTLTARTDRGELLSFAFDKIRHVSRGEQSIVLELAKIPPYSLEKLEQEIADRS